jgi:hypothetical protein
MKTSLTNAMSSSPKRAKIIEKKNRKDKFLFSSVRTFIFFCSLTSVFLGLYLTYSKWWDLPSIIT